MIDPNFRRSDDGRRCMKCRNQHNLERYESRSDGSESCDICLRGVAFLLNLDELICFVCDEFEQDPDLA